MALLKVKLLAPAISNYYSFNNLRFSSKQPSSKVKVLASAIFKLLLNQRSRELRNLALGSQLKKIYKRSYGRNDKKVIKKLTNEVIKEVIGEMTEKL